MAARFQQLGAFIGSTMQKHLWPIADQGLIAAASFVTIVFIARGLSIEEFGAYTLVYSLIYFASSMQASLITQPHNVLGAIRKGEDYVRYTTATAVGQVALATGSALLALGAGAVARVFGWEVAPILFAAAPAMFAWQMQEFVRRVLYTENRILAAFVNDLLAYGAQVFLIAVLWHQEILTASAALYVLAGTCALSTVLGCWQLRASVCRSFDRAMLWENWHFGKWVAGGTIVGEWLSAQMLVFIAAAMLGAAAAGVLRAIHTLFGPARILAQVFSITLPTRLARALADEGPEAFQVHLRQTLLVAIPVLGSYCMLVAALAKPLLQLVFGEKYQEYNWVLVLYAASAFLTYLWMIGTAVLRAQRLTRPIFISEVIYLFIVPLGALLIPLWGIHGLVVGLIAGDIAALVYVVWAHLRCTTDADIVRQDLLDTNLAGVRAEGALR